MLLAKAVYSAGLCEAEVTSLGEAMAVEVSSKKVSKVEDGPPPFPDELIEPLKKKRAAGGGGLKGISGGRA